MEMNEIEKDTSERSLRPEPDQKIDPRALTVWRMTGSIISFCAWLVAIGVTILTVKFAWPWYIIPILAVLALLLTVLEIVIIPTVRVRRWRYAVSETEIDLKHGVFVVERTLIPMVRVQHVDTVQGPFLRRYQLASVTIATAGGHHEIPALPVLVADELRDKIAQLARVSEDV